MQTTFRFHEHVLCLSTVHLQLVALIAALAVVSNCHTAVPRLVAFRCSRHPILSLRLPSSVQVHPTFYSPTLPYYWSYSFAAQLFTRPFLSCMRAAAGFRRPCWQHCFQLLFHMLTVVLFQFVTRSILHVVVSAFSKVSWSISAIRLPVTTHS